MTTSPTVDNAESITPPVAEGSAKDISAYTKKEPRHYNWYHYYLYRFCSWVHWVLYHTTHQAVLIGKENIPTNIKNYIVATNHSSTLDPPLVSLIMNPKPIAWLAKRELFESPFNAWMYSGIGAIAVDRNKLDRATIRSAKMVMSATDWLLGIFPEGTRIEGDDVADAKKGVAYFSRSCKVGVLPMGIAHNVGRKNRSVLLVGEFIPYDETRSMDEMTALLQERLSQLKEQARNS